MTVISPKQAASLAKRVYDAISDDQVEAVFIENGMKPYPIKSGSPILHATVGGYIIKRLDAFAMVGVIDNGAEQELVLVFRGTKFKQPQDLLTNANTGIRNGVAGAPVHIGFDKVFDSLKGDLQILFANAAQIRRVHCIGHSLGGAIATLAADWIGYTMGKTRYAELYTFGSPRVGNEFFARRLTKQLPQVRNRRIFHETDPVPDLPIYPFMHVPFPGLGIHLPSEQHPLLAAHSIKLYGLSVEGKGWGQLQRHAPTYDTQEKIKHFLRSKRPVTTSDTKAMRTLNNALVWVMSKLMTNGVRVINWAFYVGSTLADDLARALKAGIDFSKDMRDWVILLMKKIAQAVGIKIRTTTKAFTQLMMQKLLKMLITKMAENARRAMENMLK